MVGLNSQNYHQMMSLICFFLFDQKSKLFSFNICDFMFTSILEKMYGKFSHFGWGLAPLLAHIKFVNVSKQ